MSRTVLVTGGTGGIGGAVAERFVSAGDRVVIAGREPERTQRVASRLGARAITCDVTDVAAVESLAEQIPELDVLACAAGGLVPARTAGTELQGIVQTWEDSYALNVIGAVAVVTAMLPRMRAGGVILTVSSIGAEYAGNCYGAAKAALAAWTAGLSAEVGARGIRANAISPGYIEDTGFFGDSMTPERRQRLIDATHDKRPGRPDDVGGAWRTSWRAPTRSTSPARRCT